MPPAEGTITSSISAFSPAPRRIEMRHVIDTENSGKTDLFVTFFWRIKATNGQATCVKSPRRHRIRTVVPIVPEPPNVFPRLMLRFAAYYDTAGQTVLQRSILTRNARHIVSSRKTPGQFNGRNTGALRVPQQHRNINWRQVSARIRSAAFSPIMIAGALVLPDTISGMIEQSATLSPSTPRTLSCASTTARSSRPILQVPAG